MWKVLFIYLPNHSLLRLFLYSHPPCKFNLNLLRLSNCDLMHIVVAIEGKAIQVAYEYQAAALILHLAAKVHNNKL
jgi:hypothetical protein